MRKVLIMLMLVMLSGSALAGTQYINTAGGNQSVGNSDLLYLDNTNGKIGLGDNTPTGKLDVAGTIGVNDAIVIDANGNWTGNIISIAKGGTGASSAAAARTNLGATTVGSNLFTLANPGAITFIRINADNSVSTLDAATFRTAIGAGNGTVTSVALSLPAQFTVSGSPVTTTGTLTAAWASAAANTVFAAPSGSAGTPSFRAIVDNDVPNSITVSGGTLGSNTISSTAAWSVTDNLSVDSGTFYVDGTNNRVGVGTTSPGTTLDVNGWIRGKTGYVDTNMLDTTTWNVSNGTIGGFSVNGGAAENSRTWSTDPLGRPALVWKSDTDGANDGSGGWNYNNIPINNSKAYRLTVWVKKHGTTAGNVYLGADGANTLWLNGTQNTNPYFMSFSSGSLQSDRWYLLVGYLHANDDTSLVNYSGVYDGVTGKKILSGNDFKLAGLTNYQIHRTYNYYDTVAGDTQYFWGPRFEELNGREPTIEALLGIPQAATNDQQSYMGGKVGINDSSPSNTLDVTGSIGISDVTAIDSSRNANFANNVTLGNDVALSRGAANRLDLANGDGLNLVSGNISIGGTQIVDTSRNWTGNTIWVSKGGTGATDATTARTNLGAAGTGNCAAGQVVMNTTTSGVQCVAAATGNVSGSGSTGYVASWTSGTSLGTGTLWQNTTHVGIGTASPGDKLDINGGIRLERLSGTPPSGGSTYGQIYEWTNLIGSSDGIVYQADNHQFRNYDATPEMTITGGAVGIGTTSPVSELHVVSTSTTNADRGIISSQHNSGIHAPQITLRKSEGTAAAPLTVASGDYAGRIQFEAYGTTYAPRAFIDAAVRGTVSADNVPTDLVFSTTTTSSPTERMRIDSAGAIFLGPHPGGTPSVNPGDVMIGNQKVIRGRNAANNAYIAMMYVDASDHIVIGSGDTVTTAGNVGIGTTSPSAPLTVKAGADGKYMHLRYSDTMAPIEIGGIAYTGTGVWAERGWIGVNLNSSSSPAQFSTGGPSWYVDMNAQADSFGVYRIPAGGAAAGMLTINSAGNTAVTGTLSGTQLISTVATGTAPLTVASTTVVTNLNADTVDGQSYNANWPTTLANIQSATTNDFHNIGGTDDDVPENGDFGNAADLDNTGAVKANAVALTTDTTGNYVANVSGNSQITVSGVAGEGWTPALSITADSIGDTQLAYDTGQALTTTSSPTFSTVQAANFRDGTGAYNVNLGSGGSEGRGLVAGYSGGSYGGIGYNIRHTAVGGSYIAPSADTSSYLLFTAGGFTFQGAPAGTAGRTLALSNLATISAAGVFNAAGGVQSAGNAVLTTATTFGGDVSGTYSNIQIGSGAVGSTEISDGSVASGDVAFNYADSPSKGGPAQMLYYEDNRVVLPNELSGNRLKFGFGSWNNDGAGPYADFLHLNSYGDGSGGNQNLLMIRKDGTIGMRIWTQTFNSGSAYASYKDVALIGDAVSFTTVRATTGNNGLDLGNGDAETDIYYRQANSNWQVGVNGNYGSGSFFWYRDGTGYRAGLDTSGNMFIEGATYSPIYYDRTGTTYYVDISNTGTSANLAGKAVSGGYTLADAATDNLVFNGDFETGTAAGWNTGTAPTIVAGGISGNYAAQFTGSSTMLSDDLIPVDPVHDVIQLEAYLKKTVAGGTPGTLYFGYIAYDSSGAAITTAPCGTYCYFAASGYGLPADGNWHKFSATTSGEGVAYPNFPVGTKYVRVLGLINYGASGDAVTQVDHVRVWKINRGPLYVGTDQIGSNQVDYQATSKIYTASNNDLTLDAASTGNVVVIVG